MNNSALNEDIEKDVLPWLRLAEDLRVLQLDVEVSCNRQLLCTPSLNLTPFIAVKDAANLRYG